MHLALKTKMRYLGLISSFTSSHLNKWEICTKSKLTKKSCPSIYRETELLELIHSDLEDLKQTITRGGKKY